MRLVAYISTIAGALISLPANAAPFCIMTQTLPPQCIYVDAAECTREAARQGGACSANASELHLVQGIGGFCVVTSGLASVCAYHDRQTCDREAARQRGACVDAPGLSPTVSSPDPYSPINGR